VGSSGTKSPRFDAAVVAYIKAITTVTASI